MKRQNRRCADALIAGSCALFAGVTPAAASTATFTGDPTVNPDALTALSTRGDNAGFVVRDNETVGLIFDEPFATSRTDRVAVFTLPSQGAARLTVRFGVFNGGAPVFVRQVRLGDGRNRNVGNLFQRGCSAFGGCDFIEFFVDRTRRGATGVEIDYVDINGEVVTVAAPTPEPGAWAFMIFGFAAIAWRAKQLRFASGRGGVATV